MVKVEQNNVPELRFSEFSNLWEEKRLGEFLSFKNGINADKSKYGKGEKFINVLDIIADNPITNDSIIGRVEVSDKVFKKNEVVFGDVLFQRSSEIREEAGQSNVYLDKKRSSTFGGFVIRGRPITSFDPIYFNFLLKTWSARKEITTKSGGSTRFNVGQDSLGEVIVHVTEDQMEQQKTATFLTSVDDRLKQLRRKHEQLKIYKRGLMQKIFSQQLRFKQGDGANFPDWKETKLLDVFKERKELSTKNNGYEHISLTKEGVVPKTKRYERDFLVGDDDIKKYKITRKHDICYNPANLKFGVICRNKFGSGIFSPIYVTFEVTGSDVEFIEYFVTRPDFINKVRKYEEGTVYERQAVKPADFLKFSITIPCIKEQQKIANLLSSLDKKIDATTTQITQTETFKKGLLQKMFV